MTRATRVLKLRKLLEGFAQCQQDICISGLALDSREVLSGYIFFAVRGSEKHGLKFASQAIENGAAAVVFEVNGAEDEVFEAPTGVEKIGILNLDRCIGEIASRFYDNPSGKLKVIGITGTNGKTTCSHFIAQVLDHCGVIGTLGWGEPGNLQPTINTTPDALSIQQMLAKFVEQQKDTVVMEVSSHGLAQGRVNGIQFTGAVMTNFSRDHLDYHGTMEAYLQAKLELLNKSELEFTVLNMDDEYIDRFVDAVSENTVIWGFSRKDRRHAGCCRVTAENIELGRYGVKFDLHFKNQNIKVDAPVFGEFNLENVLAVMTTQLALDLPLQQAADQIQFIKPVSGRMECIDSGENMPVIFIDYAHTPDSLNKALSAIKNHCKQGLWLVFGCGGDRDRGKRPQMGKIAERWADHVIVTNDNPRSENPEDIIEDIISGCSAAEIEVIQDRTSAIHMAIERAVSDDMVLIAGKGHENYQEVKGVRYPYSDLNAIREIVNNRTGALS